MKYVSTPYGVIPASFERFLEAGPTVWARVNPKVPSHLHLTANADGTLPAGAFLDYLYWRRNLNPTRFDHFHPNLAQLLATPAITPNIPITPVSPQSITPSPPLSPPEKQIITPEPATIWVMLGVLGTGIWGKRMRRLGQSLLESLR